VILIAVTMKSTVSSKTLVQFTRLCGITSQKCTIFLSHVYYSVYHKCTSFLFAHTAFYIKSVWMSNEKIGLHLIAPADK